MTMDTGALSGGAAVGLLVAGFAAWYGAGGPALGTTDSAWSLVLGGGVGGALLGATALVWVARRATAASIRKDVAFVGILAGFCGVSAALWANQALDASAARVERGACERKEEPSKGPDLCVLRTPSGQRALPLSVVQGCGACAAGARVELTLRAGAFGAAWVEQARCP